MDETLKLAVEGYLQLKGLKRGDYYDTVIDVMKVFRLSFSEATECVMAAPDFKESDTDIQEEFFKRFRKPRQTGWITAAHYHLIVEKIKAKMFEEIPIKNNHGQQP